VNTVFNDAFYWVLNMSITATVAGMVVLIMRQIKHIPRTIIYMLWLLPFIRFAVPFSFSYKYSVMNLLDGIAVKTVPVTESVPVTFDFMPDLSATNVVRAAVSYFPVEYKTNLLENVFSIASLIWMIIAASAIIASIILYHVAKSEIRNAKHLNGNIYVSDKVLSPAVIGIYRPKIIIPGYLKDESMEYILMHEKIHIRRLDNLWRIIAVFTCCLHWFNPFVWLFLKYFFEDMELSCDEKVLGKCSDNQKHDYAKYLVEYEAKKTIFASAFGGVKTRTRIEKILSYRELTVFSSVCFFALIIAAAITLLTNAAI